MVSLLFNCPAIVDKKFTTSEHPYYPYISPGSYRSWFMPLPVYKDRFDYAAWKREKERKVA